MNFLERPRMRDRIHSILALSLLLAACGGGRSGPPLLGYGVSTPTEVTYVYGDTTVVSLAIMGQRMEMSQRGVADYAVKFGPTRTGLDVTLTVKELAAVINQPMGAPLRIDKSDVTGDLVFTLDRRGNPTISERPEVSDGASQMVSSLGLAYTFFPRLPDRVVGTGDSWVDTVSYEGQDGPGLRSELTILRYTVTGDTVVAGRSLMAISLQGTTKSTMEMELAGMSITQSSDLVVEGYVLWDAQRGLMVESFKKATGSGTVRVPVAPGPLPIQISAIQRARLKGM